MTEIPRLRMARMIKSSEADGTFDLLFWDKVGAEGRFAAAWEMISEIEAIKGKEVGEPRLQRAVQSIQRIQG